MDNLKQLFCETLNINFIQAIMSNPRTKEGIIKVKIRPVEMKGKLFFQLESFSNTQAFHENLEAEEAVVRICAYMKEFRQVQMMTKEQDYTVLVSKKGKVTVQKKRAKECRENQVHTHNRSKNYILQEGMCIPFLQDLGVMTKEGKIVQTKFDKFRQINRFLEFIEDILPQLDKDREVTILDFGCGKSYLTFAMYYYLHELKQYDIRIIGLDLKKDVIAHCRELGKKYGYEKLIFSEGDIADYEGVSEVDMVVTLHACDTATDYALAKAIGWNARVILSVPCCQHELNGQMRNDILSPVMKYGLLKERFAALVTDGLRAQYLESRGYETQVLEFIDMENTPKNILLRAVKNGNTNAAHAAECREQIQACEEFLQVMPTLGKLMVNETEDLGKQDKKNRRQDKKSGKQDKGSRKRDKKEQEIR